MGKDKKDKKKDKKSKGGDSSSLAAEESAAAPAVSVAPIISAEPPTPPKDVCSEHPTNKLIKYCSSCEMCICKICSDTGRHNEITHELSNIDEAYDVHRNMLSDLADSSLDHKLTEMKREVTIITDLLQKIQVSRLKIELETRSDFDDIIGRLKDEESRKKSILQTDLFNLRAGINEAQKIMDRIKGVNTTTTKLSINEERVLFLNDLRKIHERLQIISHKKWKNGNYGIREDDFPREVHQRKSRLKEADQLSEKQSVKDEFVDYLLNERLRLLQRVQQQTEQIQMMEQSTQNEMKHWMKLTDKFVVSLQQFKMQCEYCSQPLNQESVNSYCSQNKPVHSQKYSCCNDSVKSPNRSFDARNTGHHRFIKTD